LVAAGTLIRDQLVPVRTPSPQNNVWQNVWQHIWQCLAMIKSSQTTTISPQQ